jgi:tetratricopeptide (TPR) repeat protein
VWPSAAVKQIALAETYAEDGDYAAAVVAANAALALDASVSIRAAAAFVFLDAGDGTAAARLAAVLSEQLSAHAQAYSRTIEAVQLRQDGEFVEAIARLGEALEFADLWRIRYERARAYLEGGFFAEAFDEYERCRERRGEATALYLDDTPTFRSLAPLSYWLGRSQEALGMQQDAAENYRSYLDLRSDGPLAADARARLQ